jgi:3-phosphoshikimate 1-carboxyvinyltransferase
MKKIPKISNPKVWIKAPPSKAHTLRSLIIGGLAEGITTIHNPLLGQDQLNVIECLEGLGVAVETSPEKITVLREKGWFNPVRDELNVGESGVGMNFLISAVNYANKPVVLTGAKRILERPVDEVVNGVRQLGGHVDYLHHEGFPPVKAGGSGIKGGRAVISGSKSSQYFSSITIASPLAENDVCLICKDNFTEKPYLDITIEMMEKFGVKATNHNYREININSGQIYQGKDITIEGDYSSASFFFIAAAITGAEVVIEGLNPVSKQGDRHIVDLVSKMGCQIEWKGQTVTARGGPLSSIEVDMSNWPDLVPPMGVAAAFAEGTSRFTHIGHLRYKECDRLAVMAKELDKMGVKAECEEDALVVHGNRKARGARIDPHNDHRIAMSFAVAGLVTGNQIVENEGCVAKSFPDFWERFKVFYC